MMKLLVFLILVGLKSCFSTDNCGKAAIINVVHQMFSSISYNPKTLFLSPLAISGSILNKESLSTCDLGQKLDILLNKLIDITSKLDKLGNLIECKHSDTEKILYSLRDKMSHIINKIKEFLKEKDRDEKDKEVIANLCINDSEGINKIYTLFTNLLEENNVIYYFKHCANYESSYIEKWKFELVKIRTLIVFLIKACEDSYYPSQFIGYIFIDKTNDLINYYTEYVLLKEFNKHMNETLKPILNEGKSAQETVSILNEKFKFYKWSIIFYSADINEHAASFSSESMYCGSHFFLRELEHKRNALVAWCFPNNLDNSQIYLQYNPPVNGTNKAKQLNNKLKEINPRRNFILVVDVAYYPFDNYPKPDHFGEYKYKNIIPFCDQCQNVFMKNRNNLFLFASGYNTGFIPVEYEKESIYNHAIWFSKESINNVKNATLVKHETLSIYDYYKQTTVQTPFECMKLCKNDSNCTSASFNFNNKFCFFGSNFKDDIKVYKDSVSITFSYYDLKYTKKVFSDTIFYEEYTQKINVSSEDECFAYCLAESKCIGYTYFLSKNICKLCDKNLKFLKKRNINSYIIGNFDPVKDLEHPIVENDKRLFNHYKDIENISSHENCWKDCLKEDQCIASLFQVNLCFLYNENLSFGFEKGFKAYSKNLDRIKDLEHPIVENDKRLFNHYMELKNISSHKQCWKYCLKEDGCIASLFHKFPWDQYNLCFLYNETLSYEFEKGFKAHSKNLRRIQLKLVNPNFRNYHVIQSDLKTNWGEWGEMEFCRNKNFAYGFKTRIERQYGYFVDDTSMNAIKLFCLENDEIHSLQQTGGNWGKSAICPHNGRIKGFKINAEPPQSNYKDNTATNAIRLLCEHNNIILKSDEYNHGEWWSDWILCPENEFIIGLQTQVQESNVRDNTALNNIRFACAAFHSLDLNSRKKKINY